MLSRQCGQGSHFCQVGQGGHTGQLGRVFKLDNEVKSVCRFKIIHSHFVALKCSYFAFIYLHRGELGGQGVQGGPSGQGTYESQVVKGGQVAQAGRGG